MMLENLICIGGVNISLGRFPHLLMKSYLFEKKLLNGKCAFEKDMLSSALQLY